MLRSLDSCKSSLLLLNLLLPLSVLLPLVKSDPVESTPVSYLEKLPEMFFNQWNIYTKMHDIWCTYIDKFSINHSIVEIIAWKSMIFGACYCFLKFVFNQRAICTFFLILFIFITKIAWICLMFTKWANRAFYVFANCIFSWKYISARFQVCHVPPSLTPVWPNLIMVSFQQSFEVEAFNEVVGLQLYVNSTVVKEVGAVL